MLKGSSAPTAELVNNYPINRMMSKGVIVMYMMLNFMEEIEPATNVLLNLRDLLKAFEYIFYALMELPFDLMISRFGY